MPVMTMTYFTRAVLGNLLNTHDDVDFSTQVWPIIVKELAFWYYRELFAGHPDRVHGSWEDVARAFETEAWGSEDLGKVLRDSVSPKDVFDIDAFDRPLQGRSFDSLDDVQSFVSRYVSRDLHLRESDKHSETLALFWAMRAELRRDRRTQHASILVGPFQVPLDHLLVAWVLQLRG